MEDSMNTTSNSSKGITATKHTKEEEEESGWTAYFEDFCDNNNNNNGDDDDDIFSSSSSLVSDAATGGAAWRHRHLPSLIKNGSSPKFPKKLNFKKTRTKEISYDDSLEDTASSPVNSPKVSSRNRNTNHDQIKGREGWMEEEYRDERKSKGENECADLKTRGLSLVPMSMLVNYFG